MAKVLVLYYSAYGHIEKMAEAVAAGARSAGAQADVSRAPLQLSGTDERGRDRRRRTLRCHHHRGRRRLAPTERDRPRGRTSPRGTRREDGDQTVRLIRSAVDVLVNPMRF